MTGIRQIAQAAAAALTVAYAFAAHAQDIKIGYTADQSGSGVAELGIAGRWGFDQVIATDNFWDGDDLTPMIRGENCYEMGKLRKILAALQARPADVIFTSDHLSDLPVFDWADRQVVANPHAPLRRVALARGWPVFDWAATGSRTAG